MLKVNLFGNCMRVCGVYILEKVKIRFFDFRVLR